MGLQNLDVGLVRHGGFEAFFALIYGGSTGLDVGDTDLAGITDRLGKPKACYLIAKHIVGSDIGQREITFATSLLILAVIDVATLSYPSTLSSTFDGGKVTAACPALVIKRKSISIPAAIGHLTGLIAW